MQGAEDEKVDYKRDGDRRRRKSGRDDGWTIALRGAIGASHFRFWRNWEESKKKSIASSFSSV